jgi:hypothetical protein
MNIAESLRKQAVIFDVIEELRSSGSWCGETHVQKTVYFIEQLTSGGIGYPFILYKHGPFSFDLSGDLAVMNVRRYVEDEIETPQYGPRIKPSPDPAVRQILHHEYGNLSQSLARIRHFVIKHLAPYGVATLERLATALYFTKQQVVVDIVERAKRIHQVKPHISEALALEAVKTVEQILAEWNAQSVATEAVSV